MTPGMPIAEPPAWFRDALAATPSVGAVRCADALIRFRCWGPPDGAGVVLVHGAAAHARWWDHVAPLLGPDLRVVALDLSGHGTSDRRPAYSVDLWAQEVLAVAEATCAGQPVLVGHSMGGSIAVAAAATSNVPRALILLDTAIQRVPPGAPLEVARRSRASAPPRVYASQEEAVRSFRTIPAQPWSLPYVLTHIARASVTQVEGGWTWQVDRRVFGHDRLPLAGLGAACCPVTLVRAEHGIISPGLAARMIRASGSRLGVVQLPGAYHHMMIDRPLETIAAVRSRLGSSVPDPLQNLQ
jgi:pimeloyl-ACP methyl ester carboxylesterase